jgi:hypothetical protein
MSDDPKVVNSSEKGGFTGQQCTVRPETGDALKRLLVKTQQPVCKLHRTVKSTANDARFSAMERDIAARIAADLEHHFAYLQRWAWRLKQGCHQRILKRLRPMPGAREGKAKGRRQIGLGRPPAGTHPTGKSG